MPRKLLVEYECDRCGRKWYEPYKEGEEPPEAPQLQLTCSAGEQLREIDFEALCQSCVQTVMNLIDSMDRLEKRSPRAKKNSVPEDAEVMVVEQV